MRWIVLLTTGVLAVFGAGCDKTIYRAYESHYCSSTSDDEPYHECSKSSDLVCINTYSQSYPQTDGRPPVVRDMWLCRLACDPTTAASTCMPDEVCCPGPIYGRNYGRQHACVRPALCANPPAPPARDAGTNRDASASDVPRDTTSGSDISSDAPEASVPDASDAASTSDVSGADAISLDAPADI